jgi:hypothetical protein
MQTATQGTVEQSTALVLKSDVDRVRSIFENHCYAVVQSVLDIYKFEETFNALYPKLLNTARYRVAYTNGNVHDAEEVVANTREKILRVILSGRLAIALEKMQHGLIEKHNRKVEHDSQVAKINGVKYEMPATPVIEPANLLAIYIKRALYTVGIDWYEKRKNNRTDSLEFAADGEVAEKPVPDETDSGQIEDAYIRREVQNDYLSAVRTAILVTGENIKRDMLKAKTDSAKEKARKQELALKAVIAIYYGGQSLEAIAEKRGVTIGTIKGETDRMRDKIKRNLPMEFRQAQKTDWTELVRALADSL